MTPAFVEQFTQRIANVVSRQFNKRNPELEAETSELRVTILHESVAKSGRSISIRKTPPLIRLTAESAIAEKFCSEELLAVLINCVKTKMNITFCGMPGIGKTECVKFFSQFIPANERVITIEDTLEIRYAETNPGKEAAKATHKRLRQVEFRTQGPDHPILWANSANVPESYYLKFFIFQVVDEK